MDVTAKIRYRAEEAKAKLIFIKDDIIKLKFEQEQKAITPGQSVVFYKDDIVLGGAKII